MRWLKAGRTLAVLCVAAFAVCSIASASASGSTWRIVKERWDATDEKGFEEFVTRLGAEDCWSIDACMKSPANPYRHTDPRVKFLIDCADVPYFLRAYYAWKNGLPFAWQSAMQSSDGPRGDIRYSSGGNRVVGRSYVLATASGVPAIPLLFEIVNTVSTAMYRRDARSDSSTYFTDTYSPRLDRNAIRPGTIAYDVNGHVAIVWRVEPGGRILIFSSHPDHTLSRSFVGREFLRTGPELGSIFQNWRPITLVGAKRMANGTLVGGRIVGTPNADIPEFSLEQYVGNPPVNPTLWGVAKFVKDNEEMDFYTYLRSSVSMGELEYHPVDEVRSMMQTLCNDIHSRKQAVEISRNEGRTHMMAPPAKLPRNIYGTDGVWELYSTPSRDARLKTAFKEMHDQITEFVRMKAMDAPRLSYKGTDIAGDMLKAYNEESAACVTEYTTTSGRHVPMSIDDVSRRLFKLSFDPYQCVERRWGATDPAELSSCPDGPEKTRWYEAEQPLRNQIDRTYDVEMDYAVDQLERGPYGTESGRGVATAPEVDVKTYLESQALNKSALN
ncbi:MAG: hypothetical protein K8R18_17420 [Parvibaculum sp.]|uniref:hypothetical protein n=1 Tax=Parvibaculum sp. TaxID=2024848 RepID=UPI0025D03333|nr:hypothetical protein [Parvibaculum sp.]MCE9651402.1 hypothetical protein [Parvibaculum sp.]